jgi:hypothetical protein
MTDPSDLPIYTHTYVLGADIGVAQRDTHRHEYSGHRSRESAVSVEAYQGERRQQPCRRYVAAWARRTIEKSATVDKQTTGGASA